MLFLLSVSDVIAGMYPTESGCSPHDESVMIPKDTDPNVIFWPTCARLKRCGGCCGHEMLECAALRESMASVEVSY